MKLVALIFAFALPTLLISSSAFGQEAGLSTDAVKYVAYFFAMAIAAFGGTQAQSAAASVALEGIARNPSAADKIQTPILIRCLELARRRDGSVSPNPLVAV